MAKITFLLDLQATELERALAQVRAFAHLDGFVHFPFVLAEFIRACEQGVINQDFSQVVRLGIGMSLKPQPERSICRRSRRVNLSTVLRYLVSTPVSIGCL